MEMEIDNTREFIVTLLNDYRLNELRKKALEHLITNTGFKYKDDRDLHYRLRESINRYLNKIDRFKYEPVAMYLEVYDRLTYQIMSEIQSGKINEAGLKMFLELAERYVSYLNGYERIRTN